MITVEPKNREVFYKTAAHSAYVRLGLCGEGAAELIFVSEQKIRALNKRFRGVDKPTDVLSFPLIDKVLPFTAENYPHATEDDGRVLLGSIVICKSVAKKNAEEYGHGYKRELCYLFVHGLLHLLGYDHQKEQDRLTMRRMEEEILKDIGEVR